MKELVLNDGTYKYDDRTRQVSVSEDELRKLGYVKLADDEQIVQKVELSEEEAKFMKENRHLPFVRQEDRDFARASFRYCESREVGEEVYHKGNRLVQAYFIGYTVKKDTKYYIEFLPDNDFAYLNICKDNGEWEICDKKQTNDFQTQFTQDEIDNMQRMEWTKGLDFNELKVKVPDNELED